MEDMEYTTRQIALAAADYMRRMGLESVGATA